MRALSTIILIALLIGLGSCEDPGSEHVVPAATGGGSTIDKDVIPGESSTTSVTSKDIEGVASSSVSSGLKAAIGAAVGAVKGAVNGVGNGALGSIGAAVGGLAGAAGARAGADVTTDQASDENTSISDKDEVPNELDIPPPQVDLGEETNPADLLQNQHEAENIADMLENTDALRLHNHVVAPDVSLLNKRAHEAENGFKPWINNFDPLKQTHPLAPPSDLPQTPGQEYRKAQVPSLKAPVTDSIPALAQFNTIHQDVTEFSLQKAHEGDNLSLDSVKITSNLMDHIGKAGESFADAPIDTPGKSLTEAAKSFADVVIDSPANALSEIHRDDINTPITFLPSDGLADGLVEEPMHSPDALPEDVVPMDQADQETEVRVEETASIEEIEETPVEEEAPPPAAEDSDPNTPSPK